MRHIRWILLVVWSVPAAVLAQASPPRLFFSDLTSGPASGGENGAGAFVTVRGLGFGAVQGASRVTIGGGAAGAYRSWSDTRIVFQLGAAAQTGFIVVETANGTSNGLPFTVRPGAIYFVATNGDDANPGTFAAPWRTLVRAKNTIAPGDVAYARDGVTQTDEDFHNASLSIETSGEPGRPKALIAYPGALVTVGNTAPDRMGIRVPNIGIAATDWVIAGLVVRGERSAIDVGGDGSQRWRVVNNDISCPIGDGQTGCFAAGLASDIDFLGNDVHDVSAQLGTLPSKQYHAVYFTTDTNHVRVAWNHIHDNKSCRALQFHSSPLCFPECGPGDTTGFNQYDLHVHDNLIHGDTCDGINFATVDPSRGTVEAYNNVIYAVGLGPDPPDGGANYACVNVPGITNTGPDGTGTVNVYNNTFYDCGGQGGWDAGFFTRSEYSTGLYLGLRNNVVYALGGEAYVGEGSTTSLITGTHNLWFGAGPGPAYLSNNVNADPLFVNAGARDFHLQAGSPAVDAAAAPAPATDHDGLARPQGYGPDIGAYEFPAPVCAVVVEPSTLRTAIVGQAYSQTFTQTGGAPPAVFSLAGALPAGLSFNAGGAVLSGVPTQTGLFVVTVSVIDANDCTATRTYNLAVSSALPIEAVALAVDAAGNSVLEPGETVVVAPTWRNGTAGQVTLSGTASSFIGPPPATYTLSDASAGYGPIAPGASARCSTATGDCYSLSIGMGARPLAHWDASVAESLTSGGPRAWTLHVGDSFGDVPRASAFYRFVETLLHRGVTGGCSSAPPQYCPATAVTRAQMAVFVLVAREGSGYSPAPCVAGGELFADVPAASGFCRWIEELARRGVVTGCGGGSYCPQGPVSRAQMAVFVLLTREPGLSPPACTAGGELFADVPAADGFCRWIEELARRGVVTGCGGGNYCPGAPVSREQMGVFITATFGLTLYGP